MSNSNEFKDSIKELKKTINYDVFNLKLYDRIAESLSTPSEAQQLYDVLNAIRIKVEYTINCKLKQTIKKRKKLLAPNGYHRNSTMSVEEGLEKIKSIPESFDGPTYLSTLQNGAQLGINRKSLRLQNFLKSIECVTCGITGSFFAIERQMQSRTYHLNLYAVNANGTETLMTHDHILARSLGGADTLENTQTMCSPCNSKKGTEERKLYELLRNIQKEESK